MTQYNGTTFIYPFTNKSRCPPSTRVFIFCTHSPINISRVSLWSINLLFDNIKKSIMCLQMQVGRSERLS